MQSKRNFRAGLPWALIAGVAACTGSIEAPDVAGSASANDSVLSQTDTNAAGAAAGAGNAGAVVPELPVWSGTIGSWCGPGDGATVWLVAQPQASACARSSRSVYSTENQVPSDGLTLELDPLQLMALPAQLSVPARHCSAASGCADVQVALKLESYAPGQGAKGSWSFTPPGQPELKGELSASWCNWDELLPAHPQGERLARDIAIQEVAVYQGVKVPIVRDLKAVAERNADLVQQREALLRVFVAPGPGFQSRELSARIALLNIDEPPRYFEQTINVAGASMEADGKSTFNLALPKDAFQEGTQYSVELRETSKCTALAGTAQGARFPETGLAPLRARLTGPVKVLLVPVRYEADGSARLPDTSPAQLEQMKNRLYAMYPTSEVTLSVRDPVGTDRTSLGDMLDQLRELRDSDAAPSDLAYYGMVRPADTFRQYCQNSCTTGIAGFGSQNGAAAAGMGIGFTDAAAGTFVHELGHIYRRPHAPCGGAAGPDESYPYPDATLGSWGYNLYTKELFDPAKHVDFMSYCSPDWISDYNYQRLLERIVVVNQRALMRRVPPAGAPRTFRTLLVSATGGTSWGLDLHPKLEPPGDPVTLDVLDTAGSLVTQVLGYREDSADGGQAYFVPAARAGWHRVQVPGGASASYADVTRNKPFTR